MLRQERMPQVPTGSQDKHGGLLKKTNPNMGLEAVEKGGEAGRQNSWTDAVSFSLLQKLKKKSFMCVCLQFLPGWDPASFQKHCFLIISVMESQAAELLHQLFGFVRTQL